MIPFITYRFFYYIFSLLVIVPGLFVLFRFGLAPSIDFTGGTAVELSIPESSASSQLIKNTFVEKGIEVASVSKNPNSNVFIVKTKPIDKQKNDEVIGALQNQFGQIGENRFETVGPIFGRELLKKTLTAALIAVIFILSYIAFAFRNLRFGIAAIIALFHDVVVVVGSFAIFGYLWGVEVDVLFVTAILTTMSFSVHDTIVVFDRIRELQKKSSGMKLADLMNQALSGTMVRSLNNSLTIIFMLVALFLLGGDNIRWFVAALLIGTISGSYSSPFVAVPILYELEKRKKK